MNRFLAFLLVPIIIVLPGCGALAQWQQNGKLDQVDQKLGQVAEGLVEIRKVQAEARAKADTDGDGALSPTEMVTYGGLLTAGMAELARRKFKSIQGQVEEANARVDHERAKRKAAEEAELEEARLALQRLRAMPAALQQVVSGQKPA